MEINDLFFTIQGEGANSGRAALFIRMPYCNLACPWCDTHFDSHRILERKELESLLNQNHCRFAVLTGGEPSIHTDVPEIIKILKSYGFTIAMESNGQFSIPDGIDFLTVSPKRWSSKSLDANPSGKDPFYIHPSVKPSEIKLIFDSTDCAAVADQIYAKCKSGEIQFQDPVNPRFYLSPEWSRRAELFPYITHYVQQNPHWRISLQTHKIMNIP